MSITLLELLSIAHPDLSIIIYHYSQTTPLYCGAASDLKVKGMEEWLIWDVSCMRAYHNNELTIYLADLNS